MAFLQTALIYSAVAEFIVPALYSAEDCSYSEIVMSLVFILQKKQKSE